MINKEIMANFQAGDLGKIFKQEFLERLEEVRIMNHANGTSVDIPFHDDDHTDADGSTIVVKIFVGTLKGLAEISTKEEKIFSVEKGKDELITYDTPASKAAVERLKNA